MARAYIHRWNTPVKIKLFGVDEFCYHAPWYDPKRVPALRTNSLYWRMPSYPTENLIAQWYLTGPGSK